MLYALKQQTTKKSIRSHDSRVYVNEADPYCVPAKVYQSVTLPQII